MKIVLIAIKLAKKRKMSLFLLTAEIIISSIVLLSSISEIIYIQNSYKIADNFEGKECYYYSSYDYYTPDFNVIEYLEDDIKNNIQTGEVKDCYIECDNGAVISALGYNDFIIDRINVELSSGVWFDRRNTKNIPIIAIGDNFKVGQTINIHDDIVAEVIGTISRDAYLLTFEGAGSTGYTSLDNILSTASGRSFIVPYHTEKYTGFPDGDYIKAMGCLGTIVKVKNPEMLSDVKSKLREYGDVSSVEEMQNNYKTENREVLFINITMTIVFLIITFVGIYAINGIQSIKNERNYTIMHILGLSQMKCMIIEAINTFAVIGIAYIVFLLLSRQIMTLITAVIDSANEEWVKIAILLYFMIIYIVTSISSIIKAGKHNIIDLYRRSE